MSWLRAIVAWVIRSFFGLLCRVHVEELSKVPRKGPLILYANHINSIEVPIMLTNLQPRPIIGFAKAESWRNPFFNLLFSLFNAIPVRRGEADLKAMQQAFKDLAAGKILVISPEGTRSYHGKLQKGLPGIVLIAVRSGAPLMPMVYWGHEHFWQDLRRLKRPNFFIRIGTPFSIDLHGESLSREVRQQAVDEIMYQLAALLPPDYRGLFSNLEQATQTYLHFEPGIKSNLELARDA